MPQTTTPLVRRKPPRPRNFPIATFVSFRPTPFACRNRLVHLAFFPVDFCATWRMGARVVRHLKQPIGFRVLKSDQRSGCLFGWAERAHFFLTETEIDLSIAQRTRASAAGVGARVLHEGGEGARLKKHGRHSACCWVLARPLFANAFMRSYNSTYYYYYSMW